MHRNNKERKKQHKTKNRHSNSSYNSIFVLLPNFIFSKKNLIFLGGVGWGVGCSLHNTKWCVWYRSVSLFCCLPCVCVWWLFPSSSTGHACCPQWMTWCRLSTFWCLSCVWCLCPVSPTAGHAYCCQTMTWWRLSTFWCLSCVWCLRPASPTGHNRSCVLPSVVETVYTLVSVLSHLQVMHAAVRGWNSEECLHADVRPVYDAFVLSHQQQVMRTAVSGWSDGDWRLFACWCLVYDVFVLFH